MKWFKHLFKKKSKKVRNVLENMEYMASIGVPYESILKYQESVNKIREYENSLQFE